MTSETPSTIIITGGAGALGRAICTHLAETGAHIVVVDVNDSAETFAAELIKMGHSASSAMCDVSDRASVIALKEGMKAQGLEISALVNLAGAVRNAPLAEVSEADFNLTYASHVRGTLNMIWAFAPAMKARGDGRIVNTSSVAARGSPAGLSYTAAKGAIEAMTRTAAIELARHGTTVNCVAPGIVDGGMFRGLPDKAQEHMISRTPMRRPANAAEVAECYRFLCSQAAGYITGQTLYVCGGASIGAFI